MNAKGLREEFCMPGIRFMKEPFWADPYNPIKDHPGSGIVLPVPDASREVDSTRKLHGVLVCLQCFSCHHGNQITSKHNH